MENRNHHDDQFSLRVPLIVPDDHEQQQQKLNHVEENNIEAGRDEYYYNTNISGNTSVFKSCFNGLNALSGSIFFSILILLYLFSFSIACVFCVTVIDPSIHYLFCCHECRRLDGFT